MYTLDDDEVIESENKLKPNQLHSQLSFFFLAFLSPHTSTHSEKLSKLKPPHIVSHPEISIHDRRAPNIYETWNSSALSFTVCARKNENYTTWLWRVSEVTPFHFSHVTAPTLKFIFCSYLFKMFRRKKKTLLTAEPTANNGKEEKKTLCAHIAHEISSSHSPRSLIERNAKLIWARLCERSHGWWWSLMNFTEPFVTPIDGWSSC